MLKKIVIKVGTNVLSQENGLLDITTISHLSDQIAQLKKQRIEVILVTSGAVGAGKKILPNTKELSKITQRQVLASVGQIRLMNTYSQLFEQYNLHVAQVLATKEDFRDRLHYLNMQNCFQALLRNDIIPIVNENDVISVSELMFTDNDELAGLIAAMVNADMLVILSNVSGVFDGSPSDPNAKILHEIDADDKRIAMLISPTKSSFGRGGMYTKFRIAQKAARVGITTIIANGKERDVLTRILKEEKVGSRFISRKPVSNLKKWLAYNELEQKGTVQINEGAVKGLQNAVSSLLPIGITHLEGDFEKGDIIKITDPNGTVLGLGMTQYNAATALRNLGQPKKKPLVHYDYLYLY